MNAVLQRAIARYARLALEYHTMVAVNYNRSDIVRLFPVGGDAGVDVYTVECGGSGMMKIRPCGWYTVVEYPHNDPPTWLTPDNTCPGCRNSIIVRFVEYGIGAIPPDRWEARPIPETQAEYDRVTLQQHRLHVRLYKAKQRIEKLAGVLSQPTMRTV